MFKVLGQTFGPENKFRWVIVPVWTLAIEANDDKFKEI
jgi:hypothetical protein